MKLRRTACRVDLEGVRQVVFRASGLLVKPAPQIVGAGLMTGGLAGTGFRDNPNLGTETNGFTELNDPIDHFRDNPNLGTETKTGVVTLADLVSEITPIWGRKHKRLKYQT